MKCWLISDTHCQHDHLVIPQGMDAVVHCGDESESFNECRNEGEARRFFEWYSALPIPNKVFIPGNHSTAIEQGLVRPYEYPGIKFLIHQESELDGLRLFGSPYTPEFFNWSYMKPREELDAVWETIPSGLDLLITHGPPKGFLDVTKDLDTRKPIHVGSRSLTRHVTTRIRPIVHAFGHIHDEPEIRNFGLVASEGITFVNCSCCDLRGQLRNHGMRIDIDPAGRSVSVL